jgi:ubiquinone/menaquinone biosynthesis C-methylase UbiE
MNEAEFDKFADEYYAMHAASIGASGEGPEYFAEYKIQDIASECDQLIRQANAPIRIIDFGAGIGGSVPYVHKYFSNVDLTCLDLSERSLEVAEKRFPSQARFVTFDGAHLPFPDDHFDISYAMCVFHHIDHAEHVSLLRELRRVIRPGGRLFIFEHNPYNPLTVRVVNQCPFDENAHLVRGGEMRQRMLAAGFAIAKIRYRIFFPNALRALRPLEKVLTWLPLGGQYYSMCTK